MDVHFGIGRHVHVDHGFELRHIQTARSHIGGHQHRATAVGKLHQNLIALALLKFAVQGQSAEALGLQDRDQITALLLGVAKRQGRFGSKVTEQLRHGMQSLTFIHFKAQLLDLGGIVLRLDFDGLRISHELRRQLVDAFGVSGREQQGLSIRRTLARYFGDVIEKTHVQHAIGLVQHQGVDVLQSQGAALQVIHDAPRRSHHHMRAMLQTQGLSTQSDATTQSHHLDVAHRAGESTNFLRDLICQLAGRAQDHRLRIELRGIEFFDQGNAKRCCFSAACAGLRQQIATSQGQGQAGGLNGRHGCVAKLGEVGQRLR